MTPALAALERERKLVKVSISRIQTRMAEYLKKPVNQELVDILELDIADLRAEKVKFDDVQRKIYPKLVANLDDATTEKDIENEWGSETEQVRASIVTMVCRVNAIKRSLEAGTSRDSLLNSTFREPSEQPNIRLPKIEVPSFTGDIRDWNDFASLFRNLVHENTSLSNVQRLYYLKLAVKGAALDLIKDYNISDANYIEVWTALSNRYDNKRATIKAHLNDFFGLQKIKSEKDLRKLLDESNKALRSLKALGEGVDNWNTIVTYWISSRLDERTSRDWEISITDFTKYPLLKQLRTFLAARAAILEDASAAPRGDRIERKPEPKRIAEPKPKTNLLTTRIKCYVCSGNHFLPDCEEFKKKNAEQKFEIVKANRLCINCFCKKHSTSECRGPKCRVCDKKHHTLLHRTSNETKEIERPALSTNERKGESEEKKINFQLNKNVVDVILPTAVAEIGTRQDLRKKFARLILDSGSQTNLISESLVKRLKVPTYRCDSWIGCLSESNVLSDRACVITISSRFPGEPSITVTADVIAKIPYEAPLSKINRILKIGDALNSAELDILSGKVELLIGAEYYERCMKKERKFVNDVAIRETIFGAVVYGKHPIEPTLAIPQTSRCLISVDEQLRKFWELEEADLCEEFNDEAEACSKHFESSYARDNDGKFVVRLPLKDNPKRLSKLFYRAESSLRRFERNCKPELKSKVNEFMKDYEDRGHMKKIGNKEIDKDQYFIPYQVVLRPTSTTTKVRVVFNASAKTRDQKSLNDILMKGPQLQPDITTILTKFRNYRIAFSADIQQMYRQIRVHSEDSKLQKILWRAEESDEICEYELTTLTYGTTPASFIATKCLEMIARDIERTKPKASKAIATEFYMDDLLTGAENIKAAIELRREIHDTLSEYGFPLRKYVSNAPELMETIDKGLIANSESVNLSIGDEVSILGLLWTPTHDQFQVKLNLTELPLKITKRIMLSELARIFDPLGFLSPATVKGKLLLQKLWKHQLSWDQEIPHDLSYSYQKYRNQLSDIEKLSIERKLCDHERHDDVHLYGFSDASDKAYAAVIYARCKYNNETKSYIVCAKTRVAPIRGSTIPRLELCGAELLAKLLKKIAPVLATPHEKIKCYTDSTIVLAWLSKPTSELKTFVANRSRRILELVPRGQWGFVKSEENPADLATRGVRAKDCGSEFWLKGPNWIRDEEKEPSEEPRLDELPELKKSKQCFMTTNSLEIVAKLLSRYSNYLKVLNVVAYVTRFGSNCRFSEKRTECKSVRLSRSEIDHALNLVIRATQVRYYPSEVESLKLKSRVSKKSALFVFHPFLDNCGIVRVGGRLKNSNLTYDLKHPILLPAKCEFARLYLTFLHERYYHASIAFLTVFANQKFRFVAGLENTIKKICHDCVKCRRYSKQTSRQIMGQLPAERVTVSRPFTTSGVDYAGPFKTKPVGHRSKVRFKSYIAVFVCYSTRAVHLEIVSELTTGAFLAALKRFSSRRGCPDTIYSDNASCFWGTSNLLDDPKIESYLPERKIKWKFSPPRAPHFGGMFEAAVGSMKKHLKKVIGDQVLTYEELTTVATDIEAILNSRPISLNNCDELDRYLTPGHFLTGTHILSPPEVDDVNQRLSVRWQLVQHLRASFWRNWRNTYLNSFQKFSKWHAESPNLKVDDVVFLKEENKEPGRYLLGRVIEVFPGTDGKVRVVRVKTCRGSFLRGIHKLSSAVGSNMLRE